MKPLMNLKTQVYELKDELSEVKNKLNELDIFKNLSIKKLEDYDKIFKEYEKKYKPKEEKSLSSVSEIKNN